MNINHFKNVRIYAISIFCMMLSLNLFANHPSEDPSKNEWVIMFDGSTFTNWKGYNRADVPGCWTIEDGTLKINRRNAEFEGNKDRGDIVFTQAFKNFEFEFEFKVSKGANSGIFYLAREIKGMPIYRSAPEYQVLDNEHHPDAKMGVNGNRKAASLYDLIPAVPQNSKPYGEWNTGKITVNNGQVTHYLNGEKVVTYTLWGNEWLNMIEGSKFKGWTEMIEAGGTERTGLIGLQDHSDDVWFKNLRIRSLD